MKKNKSAGFTLIELIIVLTLVGLLSGLVMPRMFNTLTNMELKSAARDTISFLARARTWAYYKKNHIKVSVDLEKGQLIRYVYRQATAENGAAIDGPEMVWAKVENYFLPKSVSIKRVSLQENGKDITQGRVDLVFYPTGTSNGGKIFLVSKKGRTIPVGIDVITGDVRIIENENS